MLGIVQYLATKKSIYALDELGTTNRSNLSAVVTRMIFVDEAIVSAGTAEQHRGL